MAHRIAVIPGDGIGKEVTAEALKVIAASGVEIDTVAYDLGGERYLRDGTVLPDAVLDELGGYDAILLGAVGTPDVQPGVIERGLLLKMRFELDQYINQRPFLYPERDIDFVVIRENTEVETGTLSDDGGTAPTSAAWRCGSCTATRCTTRTCAWRRRRSAGGARSRARRWRGGTGR